MKLMTKIALGVGVGVVAIQAITYPHENPAVDGEIAAPTEVAVLLNRACYDCHSNLTTWPWYTNVAPMSWLASRDVTEGRKHLNFSTFAKLSPERQSKKLGEVVDELEEDGMPPWFYLPFHPHAKLTQAEKQMVIHWAKVGAR